MKIGETFQHYKKKIMWASGLCLLPLLLIVYRYEGQSSEPKYTTTVVRKGDINASVQATGTVNPLTTVPVGSYVSGTVQYIFADFNTRVKNGQVLAQLDPAVYEAQVTTARGNLDNAETNLKTLAANIAVDEAALAKTQANLTYQVATAKRSQDLFAGGVVSADSNDLTQSTLAQTQADVQSAKATIEQAKAQLNQAQSQVTAMTGSLKQMETNLRYTTIVSPIDGTVVARNIDVGQSVAATLQAPNTFTIAQDLTRMQVYAAIDESDTGNIRIGTPVTFQVDAFPTEQFRGRVSNVRLNATTVQNVVTYNTVIDFDNPDEKLLPGETAYVTIPTGHVTDGIQIPNSALSFTPEMPRADLQALYRQNSIRREAFTTHLGGWQVVWKIGPDQKPVPVAVRAGITDFNNTQMVEGDIKENDLLITAQANAARPSAAQRAPGLGGGGRGGGLGGGR